MGVRRSEAGVTLIELMVSIGLIVTLIGTVMVAFLAQNRLYAQSDEVREAQAAARTAISTIDRYLRYAGFGVGAEFAIDVDRLCGEGPCVRDLTDDPDELAFVARSPRYFGLMEDDATGTGPPALRGDAWMVTDAALQSLTVRTNGVARRLEDGQVLLVTCPQGFTYTYVTVGQTSDIPADPGVAAITLRNAVADDSFRQNEPLNEFVCFGAGLARAFLVEQYRFFVDDVQIPTTGDTRPFLFLDRGFGDPVPVAADIEDLQVVYITANGEEWGIPSQPVDDELATGAPYATPCTHSEEIRVEHYEERSIAQCPRGCARRMDDHVANIRRVRVTVVARTPRELRGTGGAPDIDPAHVPSAFSIENRNRINEDDDGFRRVRLTSTIDLPNMTSRGLPGI